MEAENSTGMAFASLASAKKVRTALADEHPLHLKNIYKSRGSTFYSIIDTTIVDQEVKKTNPSMFRLMFQQDKELMKNKLLPLITRVAPYLAEKIIEMFLQYNAFKLQYMIKHPNYLKQEVGAAIVTLKVCEAKAAKFQREKQILRSRLYPFIRDMYPRYTVKLTEIILHLNKSRVLYLLEHSDHLRSIVDMAFLVYEALITTKAEMQNMKSKLFPLNEHQAEFILDKSIDSDILDQGSDLTNEVFKLMDYKNNLKSVQILRPETLCRNTFKELVLKLHSFILKMAAFIKQEKEIWQQTVLLIARLKFTNEISTTNSTVLEVGPHSLQLADINRLEEIESTALLPNTNFTNEFQIDTSSTSRKKVIKEKFYQLILQTYPDMADQIIKLLLEFDHSELLVILEDQYTLKELLNKIGLIQ